ncbi:MAG: hypothetical protein Ct9H90mP8_3500 [Pseudomonadota bacterium]|nr:MAG: hypothetical protein Ct9H90mP8_3500 [Pseudomonadota bacterium]
MNSDCSGFFSFPKGRMNGISHCLVCFGILNPPKSSLALVENAMEQEELNIPHLNCAAECGSVLKIKKAGVS